MSNYSLQTVKVAGLWIPFNSCSGQVVKIFHGYNCRLVSLVGKVPVYRPGGSGLIPGRTNTQGLKIIEEKVQPLL